MKPQSAIRNLVVVVAFVLAAAAPARAQQPPPPLTVDQVLDELDATIQRLRERQAPPPPPATVILTTEAELDAAYSTAADDAILVLDPALQYTKPFVVVKPVTIQSAGLRDGRMDRSVPLPRFMKGIEAAGENITLRGLEVRHSDAQMPIAVISGSHVLFDRMRILGDPDKGARRCITANSGGDVTLLRVYAADCFQPYPGVDSQALIAWSMLPGLIVDDCYLEGGSETVMFGGADSADEAHQPADIVIRNSTLTKNPAWKTVPKTVKNLVEIKAGKNILVEGNTISQSWGKAAGNGGGQDGYAIVLNVRNQDGRCPWCTVQDVTIRNNTISDAAAAINLLAIDNITETKTGVGRVPVGQLRPSVRMARVTITGNTFTNLDAVGFYGGLSPKMIIIMGGPADVTIDHNTFAGAGLKSAVYFATGPKADNLNITNNTWMATTYGVFSSAGAAATWSTFVNSGLLQGNVVQ